MRRSALATALVMAAVLALAGCTSTPPAGSPSATPTTTPAQTPTPTATPEVLVVGPAEKPPVVFDGDCAAVLTADQIAAATGLSVGEPEPASESTGVVANVGGLNCMWLADTGTIQLQMLPVAALGDAELSPSELEDYFQDCDPNWVCSSLAESAELWTASTFQVSGGMTRPVVDAWGAALGAQVDAAYAADSPQPWERDMTGWWPLLDCASVADQFAAGRAGVTGVEAGYVDPPSPGYAMADAASHHTHCALSELDAMFLDFYTYAGTAWELEGLDGFAPVDGAPGILSKRGTGMGPYGGVPYVLTDEVNVVHAEIRSDSSWTVEEIAQSLAEAASGW